MINKIKGFLNLFRSLPRIKFPHFCIVGKFSLNPPSVPKLAVEWYADGGVLIGQTMAEKKECPFCKKKVISIGVHDDEGNYHGELGCEYEADPWSGLSYALHHEGWGECIMCTDDNNEVMGGVLFDTAEEAEAALNRRCDNV